VDDDVKLIIDDCLCQLRIKNPGIFIYLKDINIECGHFSVQVGDELDPRDYTFMQQWGDVK